MRKWKEKDFQMTIEKAIEIISRKSSIPNEGESFEDIEKAYDMAVEALEKRNPKKVLTKKRRDLGSDYFFCPICKADLSVLRNKFGWIIGLRSNFCVNCGQAFDWGDVSVCFD